MTAMINDNTLDNGLAALKSAADKIYICSTQPTTYTEATSTYALGNKNFGAGSVFPSAIAAGCTTTPILLLPPMVPSVNLEPPAPSLKMSPVGQSRMSHSIASDVEPALSRRRGATVARHFRAPVRV